jgi:ribosomal protein L29
MTKKAFNELKRRTASDLEKELQLTSMELVKLNAHVATGAAAKDAGKIRNLKKRVARIRTLQRQAR